MIREQLLTKLINDHAEIYDYIISMQFLGSVEIEAAIDNTLLVNDSIEILISLIENLGITVHDSSLFEDLSNIFILSNLYNFLVPSSLIAFLENNLPIQDMVNGLLESKTDSLLLELFENLQLIFVNDDTYKSMYDLVHWNLMNDEAFTNYLSNIMKILSEDTNKLNDIDTIKVFIESLNEIQKRIQRDSKEISNDVLIIVNRWFDSLCNNNDYIDSFGWYLLNKDDVKANKFFINEFLLLYELFKKSTIGYREYYLTNDFLISESKAKAIDYIKQIDPFHDGAKN